MVSDGAIGAFLSGAAGYVGMLISVQANVRTAEASRKGLGAGLNIGFKSGAVTGMLVAGLALLSISIYYLILLKLNIVLPLSFAIGFFVSAMPMLLLFTLGNFGGYNCSDLNPFSSWFNRFRAFIVAFALLFLSYLNYSNFITQ